MHWRSGFSKSHVDVTQMIAISDVLRKPEANMFFSFVIGVGLSVLMFHRNRTEYVVPAIDVEQLVNAINKVDGKCYRYRIADASTPSA
jgi:hypothetical protein